MQGYTPEPPYAVDAEAPEADKVISKLFEKTFVHV
jgi:hypothetical protein